jgi:hypothetical protein
MRWMRSAACIVSCMVPLAWSPAPDQRSGVHSARTRRMRGLGCARDSGRARTGCRRRGSAGRRRRGGCGSVSTGSAASVDLFAPASSEVTQTSAGAPRRQRIDHGARIGFDRRPGRSRRAARCQPFGRRRGEDPAASIGRGASRPFSCITGVVESLHQLLADMVDARGRLMRVRSASGGRGPPPTIRPASTGAIAVETVRNGRAAIGALRSRISSRPSSNDPALAGGLLAAPPGRDVAAGSGPRRAPRRQPAWAGSRAAPAPRARRSLSPCWRRRRSQPVRSTSTRPGTPR